jgi:release factor glutamine methyltransferase
VATIQDLLTDAVTRLRNAGSETPRLDAEVLLGAVLGIDRTAIIAQPNVPVGDGSAARFGEVIARREAGEPVAYIRGMKEFRGLAFGVDARALIPRPETELLVELAEAEVVHRLTATPRPAGSPPLRAVDIGTGSGAVAIALAVALRRRRILDEVEIVATDSSADAIDLARENAVAHAVGDRVRFEVADLLRADPEAAAWDLIAANLPYVRSSAIADLPRATTFEPASALDGGPDGLAVIGRLLDRLPEALTDSGVALLEIGGDQETELLAAVVARLPGWACEVRRDLGGLPRVARIARPRPA